MDENTNNYKEEQLTAKQQEDIVKLMRVLDECIESMDNFYFYMKTKEMLSLSKDN